MDRRILFVAVAVSLMSAGSARAQAVATVCKDHSTTASVGRGTCSGHGGVDAKATSAAKQAAKAAAQVTCTDGTRSNPGRGACSHHGGIVGSVAAQPRAVPSLPASVPANSPARTNSQAKSRAPSATTVTNASSRKGEDNDPTDAIARCNDGMYSHAANHRGACSKHGGVAKFLKP
jgi:hypothetical protein